LKLLARERGPTATRPPPKRFADLSECEGHAQERPALVSPRSSPSGFTPLLPGRMAAGSPALASARRSPVRQGPRLGGTAPWPLRRRRSPSGRLGLIAAPGVPDAPLIAVLQEVPQEVPPQEAPPFTFDQYIDLVGAMERSPRPGRSRNVALVPPPVPSRARPGRSCLTWTSSRLDLDARGVPAT